MMAMAQFLPDWASPPGDTIADLLKEKQLPVPAFARYLGFSDHDAERLLQGHLTIQSEIAVKLEGILGAPAKFWIARETQYRADLARLVECEKRASEEEWLRRLPLKDMVDFGWIPKSESVLERLDACLRFFGISSLEQWNEQSGVALAATAFKTSRAFPSNSASVLAWLRKGEIEASISTVSSWDKERFRETLPAIRELTRERDPKRFIPELKQFCARCGVVVAIIRAPKGCRASGATRFVSSERALLLLSARYLSDDHFWFAFFHEAAHLLLHGESSIFLEGTDAPKTKEEAEADAFAAETLVPQQAWPELSLPLGMLQVARFAKRVGVSAGIVVGQLQHRGAIGRDHLNKLKIRFRWGDDLTK